MFGSAILKPDLNPRRGKKRIVLYSHSKNEPGVKYPKMTNNEAKPRSLRDQPTMTRQALRQNLREKAARDVAKTYAGVSHLGNIYYAENFPRRVRRLVRNRLAARWYRSIREQLEGNRPAPKTVFDKMKSLLPHRFQKGLMEPQYKLVPEKTNQASA
jgi:hypothetical protein